MWTEVSGGIAPAQTIAIYNDNTAQNPADILLGGAACSSNGNNSAPGNSFGRAVDASGGVLETFVQGCRTG